jgi:hypothetical protein
MERQLLEPIGQLPVADVVRRLCGVQAQVASTAELAIRLRRRTSRAGEVNRALDDGRLIKTWAMRGTLHLLTPEEGGAFLSVMAAGRVWELPSWQRYFGMRAGHWDLMREVVREALADEPLTRQQLIEVIVANPRLRHLGHELRSGWGTLLKPLAWQGDLCFGPSQGSRVTFIRPERASARWAGVPELEVAAPAAILAYLAAYGPATPYSFARWGARGRVGTRRVRAWFAELGDRLTRIEVDGEPAYVRSVDVEELAAARPSSTVRLLGGFDAYVLGPGTDDGHVVSAAHRAAVSRQAGWISPVVLRGGVVCGTWELDDGTARIRWFREAARISRAALAAEVDRLSTVIARDLRLEVGPA